MEITETIQKRKSIRAYTDAPVAAEDLEKIIEAGRWAPNAGPFQISVVRNPDLRQRLNDRTHEAMVQSGVPFLQERAALPGYQPLYSAPVVMLISVPEMPTSPLNAALAAENMILQATGLGLGSCFLFSPTLALNNPANEALARDAGIPENYKLQCVVIVGHADAQNKFSAAERAPKGTVTYVD
jgi:nitroreductase